MGKVKGGIPWALPWEASLTKLLASARLPASSFVVPSWPGVWPWLSSAERVTCCSVSVTSCRVCSLTTAVWKTGFGLMRTCRKPEEHTVSWKLLTGVCSSLYLIRNYSPNEWKQAWKQAFASVTSCCGRPDVSISVQTSTTFHLSFHLSLFLHAVVTTSLSMLTFYNLFTHFFISITHQRSNQNVDTHFYWSALNNLFITWLVITSSFYFIVTQEHFWCHFCIMTPVISWLLLCGMCSALH